MDKEKYLKIRQNILKILYENRSEFDTPIEKITVYLSDISEKELHQEIKYLDGKGYIEILGGYCGKDYLYYSGLKITSSGIDVFENNDDKYIWPFNITIHNNKFKADNSNIAIDSNKIDQNNNVDK
jgi:hypothetical protein